MQEKFLPILKGIFSSLVPLKRFSTPSGTGGTISSRYCYSVWLRHMVTAYQNGLVPPIPGTVAELGPGDSIGLGLAALLSGSQKYYALDVHQYWNAKRNGQIFEELLELFRSRAAIPGEAEFPHITPLLDNHSFPHFIFTDDILQNSLSEARINKIRDEIQHPEKISEENCIVYCVPWAGKDIIKSGSTDLIISQSVLEYADDLDTTYRVISEWLRPGGIMSHCIDLSSLGLTKEWNGHWTYSDLEWRLYKGKRIMTINRAPRSLHLSLLEKNGFTIIKCIDHKKENRLKTTDLASSYRSLNTDDLTTEVIFIQCRK